MMEKLIEIIFSAALFVNAILFIPQALKIYKEKSSRSISIPTFLGFLAIQFFVILHGILNKDYILIFGYLLSMFSCASVVALSLFYRKKFTLPNGIDQIEMLSDIIAIMPGHVYWINREGVYLGCNDNQAKSAGLSHRNEIVGKKNKDLPWNFNVGLLPEKLDEINQQVMTDKKALVVEEPGTMSDGEKKIFLSSKVPLFNRNDKVVGLVGVSIDITDRKEMEEELRHAIERSKISEQAKKEFLYNMRHDIRTPFCAIIGMVNHLMDTEKDKERKELLGYVSVSAEEHLNFLNEVLEIVNLEDSSTAILEKPFDLQALLHGLKNLMSSLAFEKNLEFIVTTENIPKNIIGDSLRTHRILMNLLSNSLKFTNEGYVKVSASAVKRTDRDILIEFKVQDTGIGIPDDKKDIIFEKFTRLTPSYSGIYQGRGLGLRIVKKFLDELGGEVFSLTRGEEGGTIFKILIPYKISLLSD